MWQSGDMKSPIIVRVLYEVADGLKWYLCEFEFFLFQPLYL